MTLGGELETVLLNFCQVFTVLRAVGLHGGRGSRKNAQTLWVVPPYSSYLKVRSRTSMILVNPWSLSSLIGSTSGHFCLTQQQHLTMDLPQ